MKTIQKNLLLACALSIGLTTVVNAETTYYTHKYQVTSTDEFPDLESSNRKENGYTDKARISDGQAYNPVDAEIQYMTSQSEGGSLDYNSEGRRTDDMYKAADELNVATYNYQEVLKLDEKAAQYDTQRKQEIAMAQQYRDNHRMPGCGRDDVCDATVRQNEAQELLIIQKREKERAKQLSYQNTAMQSKATTDAIRKQYTSADGSISDPVAFAASAGAAAFAANIVSTAAFCMLDIPAAQLEPDCKTAICTVYGKYVCRAIF